MTLESKKHYYLITGTSRGIGEALAKRLMSEENNILFCISRNQNPSISVEAYVKARPLEDIVLDLNNVSQIKEVARDIFRKISADRAASITLINNAGTIHPIRPIGDGEASEKIIRSVNVNLMAAMLLTDAFVREVQDWDMPKRVLNITTGAARRPVHAWSAYCSAKAGLEMYTHCLAKEQEEMQFPIRTVAFAPGVVNTEMQAEIRATPGETFHEKDRFVALHEQGELLSTEYVADKMVELLASPNFGSQTLMDIRTDF